MMKYASIILAGSAVALLEIVNSLPLVVVAGTFCGYGTLLLALVSYFHTAQ